MLNALTIDVEDYWSVFSRDWLRLDAEPSAAVVRNTERLLEILARFNVKATCFILGEVARKYPGLINSIARAGHEIASHGLLHTQLFKLTEEQFRAEIADARKLLQDITSAAVLGYRAPAFSIMPETQWALEALADAGFRYDSSVYPVHLKRYGWPGFPDNICEVHCASGKSIIEAPMSKVKVLGKDLPVGGGGYFRLLPYSITRRALAHIQKHRPAVIYLHPYEIDTESRDFQTEHLFRNERKAALKHHKKQLRKRDTVAEKLCCLLSEFELAPLAEVLKTTPTSSYYIQH